MSKTAIGFFKEPLTKAEESFIYHTLERTWIDRYWEKVYYSLNDALDEVYRRHAGAHFTNEQFIELLKEPYHKWLEELQAAGEVYEGRNFGIEVTFSDSRPGLWTVEYSPTITLMYCGGLEAPKSNNWKNKTQTELVNEINRHLISHPEDRMVPEGNKALDDANAKLISLIKEKGYVDQMGCIIPDFSEFLGGLIKE